MAKPLRQPPPSSSVVRLLDSSAAARAIGAPGPTASSSQTTPDLQPPPPQAKIHVGEDHDQFIKRQLVFTETTNKTFDRIVEIFRGSTRTRLKDSIVLRAIFRAMESCREEIELEAKALGPMKLPSNQREWEAERIQFENKIAEAITNGVRKAAAFRPR